MAKKHIKRIKNRNIEEWNQHRDGLIGGSDAAACADLNPHCSPITKWAEKSHLLPPFEGNMATRRGTFDEPFVANEFTMATGKKVRNVNDSYINEKYPWAIANVDRLIVGENAGLEIKTTDSRSSAASMAIAGEIPPQWYCQCMHYMGILEIPKWYLAIAVGNNELKIFEIDFDQDEFDALMDAEKQMFERIQNGTPPEADGTDSTSESLRHIYHDPIDEFVPIDAEDLIMNYLMIDKQEKDLKRRKDEYKNKIVQLIGNNIGATSGTYRIDYKPVVYKSFDSDAFMKEHPEIDYSKYMKESIRRTMRIKDGEKKK